MVPVAKEVTKEKHVKKSYKSPLTEALSIIDKHSDSQCSKKTSDPLNKKKLSPVHLDCSRASVGSLNGIVENAWVS